MTDLSKLNITPVTEDGDGIKVSGIECVSDQDDMAFQQELLCIQLLADKHGVSFSDAANVLIALRLEDIHEIVGCLPYELPYAIKEAKKYIK